MTPPFPPLELFLKLTRFGGATQPSETLANRRLASTYCRLELYSKNYVITFFNYIAL